MKKFVSPLLSIIVGALTFGMYAAPAYYLSDTGIGSAYELISFEQYAPDSIVAFSIFSIILFVLAGCLIISGIFLLLQNMNIIKSKPITKLNSILLGLTTLIAIATLICYIVYYADVASIPGAGNLVRIGATSITIAAVSIVALVVDLFTSKGKKSKKSKK